MIRTPSFVSLLLPFFTRARRGAIFAIQNVSKEGGISDGVQEILYRLGNNLVSFNFHRGAGVPGFHCPQKGVMLRYITAGNGPTPIIFIHGYSLSADAWEKVLARLPNKFTAYAYDLRGFGYSSKPDKGYTIPDFVEDLAQFMDARTFFQVRARWPFTGGKFSFRILLWPTLKGSWP